MEAALEPAPRPQAPVRGLHQEVVEEGLEQEFNSLHAQREAGLAYIASQKSEGWIALPTTMTTAGSRAARWNARRSSGCCVMSRPG